MDVSCGLKLSTRMMMSDSFGEMNDWDLLFVREIIPYSTGESFR